MTVIRLTKSVILPKKTLSKLMKELLNLGLKQSKQNQEGDNVAYFLMSRVPVRNTFCLKAVIESNKASIDVRVHTALLSYHPPYDSQMTQLNPFRHAGTLPLHSITMILGLSSHGCFLVIVRFPS